ncbi:MAG: hypothetical protein DMG54_35010 [Acidobacteria bacterium]|nr:MAG: hypothetical protein DMG54_35010 [Acidobacteriota bacterium]
MTGHCAKEVDICAQSLHASEVIPLLRKQKGFRDEITFVVPGGKEAFGISLWDQAAENAESYNRGAYAEMDWRK